MNHTIDIHRIDAKSENTPNCWRCLSSVRNPSRADVLCLPQAT